MGDIKAFADSLVKAREEFESDEYAEKNRIPVDDFELTLNLEVQARWRKGYRGNRQEPAEGAGHDIQKVFCKGKDITLLLSDDDIDRLMEALNE